MRKTRVLVANLYDYPRYYDIAYGAFTRVEADFIEAACRKYCPFPVRQLLEPACGTGRLIAELTLRGYNVIGFDLNQAALNFARRRLARRRLQTEIFTADMAEFRLRRRVDAAYCMVSTFRHLLTEEAARRHLSCVAKNLRRGGIYVLALSLLKSAGGEKAEVRRWTQSRKDTEVTTTVRSLHLDRRRRVENLRVSLHLSLASKTLRLQHDVLARTYTAPQFCRLVESVPAFELCDVFDYRFDIEKPSARSDWAEYGVFVLRRR